MKHRTTFSIEVTVEVEGEIEPLIVGKISGPPENCYPDEGGFFTITSIHLVLPGDRLEAFPLPQSLEDKLAEQVYEELKE